MKFDVTGLSYAEVLSALNSFNGSELKITKLGKNVIAEIERIPVAANAAIKLSLNGVEQVCF